MFFLLLSGDLFQYLGPAFIAELRAFRDRIAAQGVRAELESHMDTALLEKLLYQTDARPDMVIAQYQDTAQCADLMESMLFGPCRTALLVKGNLSYSDRASVMSLKGSISGVNAGRPDYFAAGQNILVSDDSSLKAAAAANAKKTAAAMLSAGDAKEAYRQFRKYAGASSDGRRTRTGQHSTWCP